MFFFWSFPMDHYFSSPNGCTCVIVCEHSDVLLNQRFIKHRSIEMKTAIVVTVFMATFKNNIYYMHIHLHNLIPQ